MPEPPRISRRRLLRTVSVGAASLGALGTVGANHEEPDGGPLADFEGTECDVDRTDDRYLPWSTNGAYGGWGGHEYHVTEPGLRGDENPIVFVHGNTREACDYADHATKFLERGYGGDQLWSITFRESTSTHAEMARQLDDFVANVCAHTGADTVDVVAHSLGVTGARFWLSDLRPYLEEEGRWPSVLLEADHPAAAPKFDVVDTFVGLAGANEGTWTCNLGGPGCQKGPAGRTTTAVVCNVISPECAQETGQPLFDINHHGTDCLDPSTTCEVNETPQSDTTDYYTIRGNADAFFVPNPDSPELAGAKANVLLPGRDHDAVRASETSIELIYQWTTEDLATRTDRATTVEANGERRGLDSLYTGGEVANVELTVEADRPMILRDRVPYDWSVDLERSEDVTAVAPRPHRGLREVYFENMRPQKSHEVSFLVEAPASSGRYEFGPAEVRTPDATEWAAVPVTTEETYVLGL
jgi:pimeloyl-ACP methyl ester carboxylesterase